MIASQPAAGQAAGRTQMLALNNIGAAYFYRDEFTLAEQYFRQSLKIAQQLDSTFEQYVMRFNLGYIQVKTANKQQGLLEMEQAYARFADLATLPDRIAMLGYLAEAYQTVGETGKEANTLRLILTKKEQELQQARDNIVLELQTKFEAEEKQLQITLLEQQAALQQAELEKSQRDRYWFGLLSVLMATALAAALAVIRHVRYLNRLLATANSQLEIVSLQDPLTQLKNRRAVTDSHIQPHDLIILLDLDHFKLLNDQYGHDFGDQVLVEFARRLQRVTRKQDLLVRWGGEEFLLIQRQIDPAQCHSMVQKVIAATTSELYKTQRMSFSAGLVLNGHRPTEFTDCLKLADQLLYKAKAAGRAQIHAVDQIWHIAAPSQPYPKSS